jgi:hypothetical protein
VTRPDLPAPRHESVDSIAARSAPAATLDRSGHELELEDTFQAPLLDERLWIAAYLPQWSSSRTAAARYDVGGGGLRLRIDADQEPWCPEFDGDLRVSSLQTGVRSGPLGSGIGQHRFRDGLAVREEQPARELYTPRYGIVEARVRTPDDPRAMAALWMIGTEDEPSRSAEICIFEIFGRDVRPDGALVGMGVHPFGDPAIRDDFERVHLAIDVREAHDYAALWSPDHVAFYVDERLVKVVHQSAAYPMQLMLDVFEFDGGPPGPRPPTGYPIVFSVEWLRGYRPTQGPAARPPAFARQG